MKSHLQRFAFIPTPRAAALRLYRQHKLLMGHASHAGEPAMHTSRPSDIMFTCSEYLRGTGILLCRRSASRAPHCPSSRVALTQPSRRQIRQQCVSTGKTVRPREYIITHRATLVPTPGRSVRNASHWSSLIRFSGDRVIFPNAALMRRQITWILLDLVGDSPPDFSGFAMPSPRPSPAPQSVETPGAGRQSSSDSCSPESEHCKV